MLISVTSCSTRDLKSITFCFRSWGSREGAHSHSYWSSASSRSLRSPRPNVGFPIVRSYIIYNPHSLIHTTHIFFTLTLLYGSFSFSSCIASTLVVSYSPLSWPFVSYRRDSCVATRPIRIAFPYIRPIWPVV